MGYCKSATAKAQFSNLAETPWKLVVNPRKNDEVLAGKARTKLINQLKMCKTALKINFYSAFALNKTEIRVRSGRNARDRLDRKENNTEPRCRTKAEFILFTLFRFYLDPLQGIDEITKAFDDFRLISWFSIFLRLNKYYFVANLYSWLTFG